jgi:acyl-homoserine lactone acylase PvdQ
MRPPAPSSTLRRLRSRLQQLGHRRSHTASGKPLLSNDMHLGLTEPNIWYMADLLAPGFHAAGVTLPGMPFVIAGHNEHVAWGFTALYADVQDLYVESLTARATTRPRTAPGSRWPWTMK